MKIKRQGGNSELPVEVIRYTYVREKINTLKIHMPDINTGYYNAYARRWYWPLTENEDKQITDYDTNAKREIANSTITRLDNCLTEKVGNFPSSDIK